MNRQTTTPQIAGTGTSDYGISKAMIACLIVVPVLAALGGVWWVLKPARVVATPTSNTAIVPMPTGAPRFNATSQPKPVAIIPENPELLRVREENATLRQQLEQTRRQLAVASAPPPAPAPPPTPKSTPVSGSAYVVRKSGQSDILRGFHVTLIADTVPPQVFQQALSIIAQNYKSEATEARKQAAEHRQQFSSLKSDSYDPGKLYEDESKNADTLAQKYSDLSTKVSGPVDSAEALKLLGATPYVKPIRDLADAITVATTTTDIQGAYKFSQAPMTAYIFATFDTSAGFLLWTVPVNGGGSKDLFNDTALVLK